MRRLSMSPVETATLANRILPAVPGGPCAPVAPVAPVSPFGPVGPVAPVAPVAPVSPLGPVGPGGPCGPTAFNDTNVELLGQGVPGETILSVPLELLTHARTCASAFAGTPTSAKATIATPTDSPCVFVRFTNGASSRLGVMYDSASAVAGAAGAAGRRGRFPGGGAGRGVRD